MGFWRKVKHFMGGHGVAVRPISVDGRDPEGARIGLDATGLTGRFEVTCTGEAMILSHRIRLFLVVDTDEGQRSVTLADDPGRPVAPEHSAPHAIEAGEAVLIDFELTDLDIAGALAAWFDPPEAGVGDPRVTLALRLEVDVEKAAVDAAARVPVALDRESAEEPDPPEHAPPPLEPSAHVEAEPPTPTEARVRLEPGSPGTFVERLRAAVAALEADPRFEIVHFDVGPPATEGEIEAARAFLPMPDDLLALYRSANGVRLRWIATDEALPGGEKVGSIQLMTLDYVFSSSGDESYRPPGGDEGPQLHVFDYFHEVNCVGLAWHAQTPSAPVLYYQEEYTSLPLELTCAQWLEAILHSRGLMHGALAMSYDVSGRRCWTVDGDEFKQSAAVLFSDYDPRFLFRDA